MILHKRQSQEVLHLQPIVTLCLFAIPKTSQRRSLISCDNTVTTATILPKGGPPCSLWAGYSDFHQLSRQSLSYTSIPLVPKLPKPSDKERDTEKNNIEKVPITRSVIVMRVKTGLCLSMSSGQRNIK
jgi:hypothetical protein